MIHIEWIILITDHYKESRLFYHDLLDLPIIHETPEEEFCQFKLDNCFLAIYGKKFITPLIGKNRIGKSASAIYSFGKSPDIDHEYQQLKAKGVQFFKKPQTQSWGQRTAYFTDPDENIWEIQQWIKK
jgi:catechol 2,3-dioxygenase-like lactoylglutathione lyase family enzyme